MKGCRCNLANRYRDAERLSICRISPRRANYGKINDTTQLPIDKYADISAGRAEMDRLPYNLVTTLLEGEQLIWRHPEPRLDAWYLLRHEAVEARPHYLVKLIC